MYLHKYLTLYVDTCNPTLVGTVQHVLQTMHIHTLFKYRYMLNNCHHYQSVSLTSTPAGVCTLNVLVAIEYVKYIWSTIDTLYTIV